jgi:hypothetical protein
VNAEPSLAPVRLLNTTLDGFDPAPYHDRLATSDWLVHAAETGSVSDDKSTYRELETTYMKLKNAANDSGDSTAAAEFFRHEMRFRRMGHWQTIVDGPSLTQRIGGIFDWIGNAVLGLSSGYGERPSYVLSFSLAIVVGFAAFYAVAAPSPGTGDVDPTAISYLLFSFQSFISFVLGRPPTELSGTVLRAATAIEGFAGAFLIALFVYTLTRSIDR